MNTVEKPAGPKQQRTIFLLLIAASLAVRAWYWLVVCDEYLVTEPYLDCRTYDVWARALVAGDWGAGRPYWMGPLYPHLLALGYALFGAGSQPVVIVQLLLTVVNLWLVHRLARRWLDPGWTLLAVLLYAGYGPPVFYAGFRLMVTVVTTLLLLIAWQSTRAVEQPHKRQWLTLGLLVGLAATARGNVLVLLPLLPLVLLGSPGHDARRVWRLGAWLWLGAAIAIAPVTLRNIVVGGDFVVLTSNVGVNLLIGQQTQYGGRFGLAEPTPRFEFDDTGETQLEADLGRDLSPAQVSRELTRQALVRVGEEPGSMLRHYGRKAYRSWSGYELPQIFSWNFWHARLAPLRLLPVTAVWLLAPGLLGGFLLRRQARRLWLVLVGGWFLGLLPFFPTSRYRQPIMGLMAIATAGWAAAVVVNWRAGRRRRSILLLVAAATLVAALWPSWSSFATADETWHCHLNRASRAATAGDRTTILEAVAEAEAVSPNRAETLYREGGYLGKVGDREGSLAAYRAAAQRAPDNPFVRYRVGLALAALDRHQEALTWFDRAADADPDWSLPVNARGLSLRTLGRLEAAAAAFARAVALAPGQARLRSNLASALAEAGRPDRAYAILQQLVRDFPEYVPGWFNLALTEAGRGNKEAARQALSRAAALPRLSATQRAQIDTLRRRLATVR